MTITKLTVVALISAVMMIIACAGEKQQTDKVQTADYLVAAVDSVGLERTGEVQVFVGDSLWEYINGGAELYHKYNFVEVATAYYNQQGAEIVVDIYRFDTPEHAFGLYSMLRAENTEPVPLGVEGFGSPTNRVFVKGVYVVMLTGFEQVDAVTAAIGKAAPIFESLVPGTTDLPAEFAVFPSENAVDRSHKLQAESFLGQEFLREVYSRKYILGADTVTLFVTEDAAGAKYIEWKDNSGAEALPDMPYDDAMGIQISSSYYGNIVAGLRGGKLVGMVGYLDNHRDFLTGWLDSMPAATP